MGKQNQTNPSLRQFYAFGKEVAELRESTQQVHGTLPKLKAETAAAKNRRMEAHRFYKMYRSKKQLDEICSYGRNSGKPLTRNHVVHLLRVDDEKDRRELAKKCANKSWSARRLDLEIRKSQPRRKYGGARQKPPQSIKEALLVTEWMVGSWFRWLVVLTTTKKKGTEPILDRLPEPVRNELLAATNGLVELHRRLERSLRRSADGPAGEDTLYSSVVDELTERSNSTKTKRSDKRPSRGPKRSSRRVKHR